MYAKTTIVGRAGRDGEKRYTPKGDPLLSFSVATDFGWGDKKTTVWYNCSLWGDRAEKLAQYITKGKMLLVEGTLSEPKPYQSKSGEWRASLNLRVDQLTFLGGRVESEYEGAEIEEYVEDDDIIPF